MDRTQTRDQYRFLFGTGHPAFDVEDLDALVDFFGDVESAEPTGWRTRPDMVAATAHHVLTGDAALWSAARGLLASGLDRHEACSQLAFAFAVALRPEADHDDDDAEHDHEADDVDPFEPIRDPRRLQEVLAGLPLADDEEIVTAIEALAAVRPFRHADEFVPLVSEAIGSTAAHELLAAQIEFALDQGASIGVIRFLPGDLVAHVPTLTAGITLTHRLTADEIESELLTSVSSDLAGFAWYDDLTIGEADIEVDGDDDGLIRWQLPAGTLAGREPGDVIAVRVDALQQITIEAVTEPEPALALADAVRAAYEAENDEVEMANSLGDILTTVLAEVPDAFAGARPPLTELCTAAGLEVRGADVGGSPEAWAELSRSERTFRLLRAADDHVDCASSAEQVLEWFDDERHDDRSIRNALRLLEDEHVAELVLDELVDPDGVSADLAAAIEVGDRLVAVARRGRQLGIACWLRGLVAERSGRVMEAEEWFVKGLSSDPDAAALIERLAWYASDRGDAVAASRLFQQLDDDQGEGRAVAAFAQTARPGVGRNDPCWCGSGRKFKQCHLGVVETPELADRIGWIMHKAFAYLRRHGGSAVSAIVGAAASWAGDDVASVRTALDDPIVFDTVLVEGGWWQRFIADRGPLLPADELGLVTRWLDVPRGVYEVVAVDRGAASVQVRDVRTGAELAVRSASTDPSVRPGVTLLARAVTDGGDGHRFVGSVVAVPADQTEYALSLCDDRDGDAICGYVGAIRT